MRPALSGPGARAIGRRPITRHWGIYTRALQAAPHREGIPPRRRSDIEHADIKRLLLFQRPSVEVSLSSADAVQPLFRYGTGNRSEEKNAYNLLLEILTPMAKSYPSEMGILAVSQGLQCLGGYGYCDEFPLEQFYRDVPHPPPFTKETTGIQGMDLRDAR